MSNPKRQKPISFEQIEEIRARVALLHEYLKPLRGKNRQLDEFIEKGLGSKTFRQKSD